VASTIIPDIAKEVEKEISRLINLSRPNLPQMKADTSDLIVNHIIEYYPYLNISEVIKTSLNAIQNELISHNLLEVEQASQRLNNLQWTEEYIKELLVKRLFTEAMEKDNLRPLIILKEPGYECLLANVKSLLPIIELHKALIKLNSSDVKRIDKLQSDLKKTIAILEYLPKWCAVDLELTSASFAFFIQDEYVRNFKDIHDCIKAPQEQTSSEKFDEVESEEDRSLQIREDGKLTSLLEYANKLNEFLLLFTEQTIAKHHKMDISKETLTKLFTVKLDPELFEKAALSKELDPLKRGIAAAIVATNEYLQVLQAGKDPDLEGFNLCCQSILQLLNYNEHQKSIRNPVDFFLNRYTMFLIGIFEDVFIRVIENLNSNSDVGDISRSPIGQNAIQIQNHVEKINVLLEMELKVEISKRTEDDGLIALISSIPNLLPNDTRDIQHWLNTKTDTEKATFSAWLTRKAQAQFAVLAVHNPARLNVIYQMCLTGV
ncbi:MAG TPA: hypothetical protein VIH61_09840, partial [Waddliaceae bacterium]